MPRAAAARAVASSPSGCARRCSAVGQMKSGVDQRRPEHLDRGVDHRGVGHDPRQEAPPGKRGAVVVQRPLVHGAADVIGEGARGQPFGSGALVVVQVQERRIVDLRRLEAGLRGLARNGQAGPIGHAAEDTGRVASPPWPSIPMRRSPALPIRGPASTMPALRDGPPYAMTEMIAAEPALAERLVRRLTDEPAVRALADDLRATADAGATDRHDRLRHQRARGDGRRRPAGRRPPRRGRGRSPGRIGAGVRADGPAAGQRPGDRRLARGRHMGHQRGAAPRRQRPARRPRSSPSATARRAPRWPTAC